MHFEIVYAADVSDPGDVSSSLRAELKAARLFDLRVGVLPFIGPSGEFVRAFDRRTASLVGELGITWLSGDQMVTCDILVACDPSVFRHMPTSAVRIRAKRLVCMVHDSPFDSHGRQLYDLDQVERNLERLFGLPVHFAPSAPNIRVQLESRLGRKPLLIKRELFNMVDTMTMRRGPKPAPRKTAIIGRHSPQDPIYWPADREALLGAYPDRDNISIRSLGDIPDGFKDWISGRWQIRPFQAEHVADFLSSLDFYVYFHGQNLPAGFRTGVAEALAASLPTIVDPSYETLFEDGAIYADPDGVAGVIDGLLSSPVKYRNQSNAAQKLVEEKFGLATYPARMRDLCDELGLPLFPTLDRRASTSPRHDPDKAGDRSVRRIADQRRALFVATNGQGLGHITRLMAIAERMTSDIEPIFFTRSAGSAIIHERGHATDYVPWSVNMGVTNESWNKAYSQELLAAIENLDIAAVIFDGTYPFSGLRVIQSVRPDIVWVWVRRALWVNGQALDPALAQNFHLVIEPGELAQDEDYGPTTRMPGLVHKVPTVLLANPREGLDRVAASERLGLDPERFTVAIQLGSERNYDYGTLPHLLVQDLLARGLQVVRIQNPLARRSEREAQDIITSSVYPLANCLKAIDLAITNAGYNTFHECVYGGVPAIFVPNESPEMDDQHLRAAYADAAGLGLRLRAVDLNRARHTLDVALSDDFRTEQHRRSARLDFVNGAAEAARIIEELVFATRTNLPLHASLPRI